MLVILTPPSFEQFWAERARYHADHGGHEDPAVLLALQEKYHMDMEGKVRGFGQR